MLATDPARLVAREGLYAPEILEAMAAQLGGFLAAFVEHPQARLDALPLTGTGHAARARSGDAFAGDERLDESFARQVAVTPEREALVADETRLTFGELDARATRLAAHLRRAGRRPARWSASASTARRAAGGDAGDPQGRRRLPAARPGLPARAHRLHARGFGARRLIVLRARPIASRLGARRGTGDVHRGAPPHGHPLPGRGAAGGARLRDLHLRLHRQPKGVMVEHRNVVNFFAGMDAALGAHDPPAPGSRSPASPSTSRCSSCSGRSPAASRWCCDRDASAAPARARARRCGQRIDFSLFYFASDERRGGEPTSTACCSKARGSPTRTASTRCGRRSATSTPSAASTRTRRSPAPRIAAVTERVQIRAGSVRAAAAPPDPRRRGVGGRRQPLERPRRASRSPRAGSRTTSCCGPRPSPTRKARDVRATSTIVRRLWRGEAVELPRRRTASRCEVRTLPRPVQPELPVWVTAAGNPETFAQAGEIGAQRAHPPARARGRGAGREARALPPGLARGRASPATGTSR